MDKGRIEEIKNYHTKVDPSINKDSFKFYRDACFQCLNEIAKLTEPQWVAHEAKGSKSSCENCQHWATKLAHSYQKIERLKQDYKHLIEVATHINESTGYQFTQPIMVAKERLERALEALERIWGRT